MRKRKEENQKCHVFHSSAFYIALTPFGATEPSPLGQREGIIKYIEQK